MKEVIDNYKYEKDLIEKGIKLIAGVDEVGRGPLVGPVVAACCVLPKDFYLEGLNDSKKLTEKKREQLAAIIKEKAIEYQIQYMSVEEVDLLNVYEASRQAMIRCIRKMKHKVDYVLSDAMPIDFEFPCLSIIKGDAKSLSIAAASVIAKVTRDKMMIDLDEKYPMYNFKGNKGYPTKAHLVALAKLGPCPEHRRSFGPVAQADLFDFTAEKGL